MLQNKTVLLGVTGSIAAYKIANLASALKKLHADVHVLMTENATNFINPITFESLTGNKCLVDTFDRNFQFQVEHVSIAKKADVVMIAPASANVIGKIAHGIADDMLTTTVMACKCPVYISPAMNTNMYENPIVQDNMKTLEKYGYHIITPASGYLACGDTGAGKMPEPDTLLQYIVQEIAFEKDLKGKKIQLTVKGTDLKSYSYISPLFSPTNSTIEIYNTALEIFIKNWSLSSKVRALSVCATDLTCDSGQISLFSQDIDKKETVDKTIDLINSKTGNTIFRASKLDTDVMTEYFNYNIGLHKVAFAHNVKDIK